MNILEVRITDIQEKLIFIHEVTKQALKELEALRKIAKNKRIDHEDCKRVSKLIKNPRIFVTHALFYNRLNDPLCIYKGGQNKQKFAS